MTFDQYRDASGQAWHANRNWRQGQAYFNTLVRVRPDLSERVRATNFDPFYNNLRLPNFLAWLEEVW